MDSLENSLCWASLEYVIPWRFENPSHFDLSLFFFLNSGLIVFEITVGNILKTHVTQLVHFDLSLFVKLNFILWKKLLRINSINARNEIYFKIIYMMLFGVLKTITFVFIRFINKHLHYINFVSCMHFLPLNPDYFSNISKMDFKIVP